MASRHNDKLNTLATPATSQPEEPLLTQPFEEWRLGNRAAVPQGERNDRQQSRVFNSSIVPQEEKNASAMNNSSSDYLVNIPMFQTAGSNKAIHVSRESTSKANALFAESDTASASASQKTAGSHLKCLKGVETTTVNSDRSKSDGDVAPVPVVCQPKAADDANRFLPLFQTAGKRMAIKVSKESISKADSLFSSCERGDSDDRYSNFEPHRKSVDTSSSDVTGATRPFVQPSSSKSAMVSFPAFQTAGKKKTIHVSAESLSKANDLFSNFVGESISSTAEIKNSRKRKKQQGPIVQTDAKKQTVNTTEESWPKANSISNVTADQQIGPNSPNIGVMAIFQTAGKKQTIHVSAEGMARANTMFDMDNEKEGKINEKRRNILVATNNHRHSKVPLLTCKTAGKGDDAEQVSVDSMPKANASTNATFPAKSNPYVKTSSATLEATATKPRTIDQPNQSSLVSTAQAIKLSAHTPVNNPYAKSKPVSSTFKPVGNCTNNIRKTFVKNPYATKSQSSISDNLTRTPAQSKVAEEIPKFPKQAEAIESSVCMSNITKSVLSASRPLPTTRFFSMADRLPSRNVSYKPAEILSVGELYRYLYHQRTEYENKTDKTDLPIDEKAGQPVCRKLTSVRITGVLLSCTYSDSGEGYAQLYGKGQWLLIGDPLDKMRFAKNQVREQTRGGSRYTPGASKCEPSASKELVLASAATLKPSNLDKKPVSADKNSSLVTPHHNKALTSNTVATSRSGGLLNDKKRKFVYNKSQARNSLSSSKILLNAKKFQTPKRMNSNSTIMNNATVKRCPLFSTVNKATMSKNKSPLSIIQNHPAPIVPVWNGSTQDGNGLDGSVTGDLVLIMGEIIVELCHVCKNVDGAVSNRENENVLAAPNPQHELRVQDVRDASRLLTNIASQEDEDKTKKCCSQCVKFLRARFVKNANGTDMNLQKEALRIRREYMRKRLNDVQELATSELKPFATGIGPLL